MFWNKQKQEPEFNPTHLYLGYKEYELLGLCSVDPTNGEAVTKVKRVKDDRIVVRWVKSSNLVPITKCEIN